MDETYAFKGDLPFSFSGIWGVAPSNKHAAVGWPSQPDSKTWRHRRTSQRGVATSTYQVEHPSSVDSFVAEMICCGRFVMRKMRTARNFLKIRFCVKEIGIYHLCWCKISMPSCFASIFIKAKKIGAMAMLYPWSLGDPRTDPAVSSGPALRRNCSCPISKAA